MVPLTMTPRSDRGVSPRPATAWDAPETQAGHGGGMSSRIPSSVLTVKIGARGGVKIGARGGVKIGARGGV
jgi:hypothetical protein